MRAEDFSFLQKTAEKERKSMKYTIVIKKLAEKFIVKLYKRY